jgi:hypothetical protein
MTTGPDALLAQFAAYVQRGFTCRECGNTFTADEYAYGHDCEEDA